MVMLMAVVTALVVQGWYEEETTDIKAKETKKIKVKNSRAGKYGIWGRQFHHIFLKLWYSNLCNYCKTI